MRRAFFALMTVSALTGVWAERPAWWIQRGVISPTKHRPSDDFAVINHGQLKKLAQAARDEMFDKLPGGPGAEIESLINRWKAHPESSDDYAAVTVGQLKAVARRFFERLHTSGQITAMPGWAFAEGSDDYAAANIGQAKALFAFSIRQSVDPRPATGSDNFDGGAGSMFAMLQSTPQVTLVVDSNGDGIPDADVAKFNLSNAANYTEDSLWQSFAPDDLGRPTQVSLSGSAKQVLTLDKDDNLTKAN